MVLGIFKIEQPSHSYPTCFSSEIYRKPQIKLSKCRFQISIRDMERPCRSTEKNKLSSLFKTKKTYLILKMK